MLVYLQAKCKKGRHAWILTVSSHAQVSPKGPCGYHAGRVVDHRHAGEHVPQLSGWSCGSARVQRGILIQMGRCCICMFMGEVLRVVYLRSAIHVSTCWCTCWLCN